MSRMWGEYVPVSVRRDRAAKEMEKLRKKGQKIEPIVIEGRQIAKKFWGKKWCDHLEAFADYDNRLPRGRTYARNGSISHLSIQKGHIEAVVSGSSLYKISVKIKMMCTNKWEAIKKRCSNQISSILEILQGKLSDSVMQVVADHQEGLFPQTNEMEFNCSCPDWADMCKHVAAVLYGIGNRLDSQPELLFLLRGVDPSELVKTQLKIDTEIKTDQLESDELADIFGIDLEETPKKKESPKISPKSEPKAKVAKPKKKIKPLDFDSLTGLELQKYRLEAGLSLARFAKLLQVTPATISRWEKSEKTPNLKDHSKKGLLLIQSTVRG